MATTVFGPSPVTIPVGTTSNIPTANGVAIGDNIEAIVFRIAIWSQADRLLSLKYWQSTDGGATWADAGAQNPFPGNPNPPIGRDGTTDSTAIFYVGPGTNRRVKMDATVTGGSISTTVTIQTIP